MKFLKSINFGESPPAFQDRIVSGCVDFRFMGQAIIGGGELLRHTAAKELY